MLEFVKGDDVLPVIQVGMDRSDITSGDTEQVIEKLDKGLLDFIVLAESPVPVWTTCIWKDPSALPITRPFLPKNIWDTT